MGDVQVQGHPRFGRCAFARKAFAPGDIVLSEEPLLITRDPEEHQNPRHGINLSIILQDGSNERAKLRDGSHVTVDLLRRYLTRFLAWADAPTQAQTKVLNEMVNTAEHKDSFCALSCEWAAGIIADRLLSRVRGIMPHMPRLLPPAVCPPGVARGQQQEVVERVLLAWELNAHRVGNRCGTAGLPLSRSSATGHSTLDPVNHLP